MTLKRISMTLCLLVAACGGADENEPAEQPIPYEEMSFAQRDAFMRAVVLPEMTKTFSAFDAKFANMTCETCHGAGVAAGTYAMPNPQIEVLPGSEEAFIEYNKDPEHAKWSQFMIDEVWPQMADLLQVAPFDPATAPMGFSCSNCHTHSAAP